MDDLPDVTEVMAQMASRGPVPLPAGFMVPAPPRATQAPAPKKASGSRKSAPPLWKAPASDEVDALIRSVAPHQLPEESESSSSSEEDDDEEEEGRDASSAGPASKKRRTALPTFHLALPPTLTTHPPDPRTLERLGLSAMTIHPIPHTRFGDASNGPSVFLPPDDPEALARLRSETWAKEDPRELIVVSMDPAIKHFALRVERRSWDGSSARLLYFNVLDLDADSAERIHDESVPKTQRRKAGKSLSHGELWTYARLHATLFTPPLSLYLQGAHIVLMEHQHDWKNPLASRIAGHALGLIASLLSVQPRFTCPLVVETHSKMKDDAITVSRDVVAKTLPQFKGNADRYRASSVVGKEKGKSKITLSHARRKTGSIETALGLTLEWGDMESHRTLDKKQSGRTELKRDDLADCVMHIEAFRRAIGWGPVPALADATD